MRYQSTNIAQNILSAEKSNDQPLVREMVIDEIVTALKDRPVLVVSAMRESNIHVPQDITNKEIADKLAYALTFNDEFKSKIPNIISEQSKQKIAAREEFSNVDPVITPIVVAVGGAITGAFKQAEKKKDLEAQQEATKQVIYSKLLGEKKKTNWIPILVVSGVLLIGAIVVWRVTKK